MMTLRLAPWRRSFAALAALGAGCTIFDGIPNIPVNNAHPSYLPLDQGVAACSLVFRCPPLGEAIARSIGVPASETSFSTCVDWLSGRLPPNRFGIDVQVAVLACVGNAPDCQAALACAFVEPLAPNDARCSDLTGDHCPSTESLVGCTNGIAEHCTTAHFGPGSECRLGLGNEGRCALSGCLPLTAGPPRCTSGVFVHCDPASNLRVAKNCAAVGLQCTEGAEGADAQCSTADGIFPCDVPGKTECAPEGDRVRACDGSFESEFDCGALGEACTADGTGAARCGRAEEACSPRDPSSNACHGSVISLCVDGEARSFDCASLGLACIPGDGARSGFCG
jgi:hypothetical protein